MNRGATKSGLHCQRITLTVALWKPFRVPRIEPGIVLDVITTIQVRDNGDLDQDDKDRGTERWLYSGYIEMMHGKIPRVINKPI